MKSVSSLLFASLLFSLPMAHAMEPRDFNAEAANQELDPKAISHKMETAQRYLEAGMEQMAANLAEFVEANPEITELPGRFAAAQAKLLKHEFAGKSFSLDALKKKTLHATAEICNKHAQSAEEVNQLALGLDVLKSTLEISAQEVSKFTPPVKKSAKTAARLWANADWASVIPGLQQVSHSLMTCLSTVLSNYEAEIAQFEGEQSGDESEDEDDKAAAEEQAAAQAESELQAMLAALSSTSSTGTDLELA